MPRASTYSYRCFYYAQNGQSAAKLRIGEGSTTIPEMGVGLQAIGNPK